MPDLAPRRGAALVLLLTALAGCGSADRSPAAPADTPPTVAGPTAPAVAPAAVPVRARSTPAALDVPAIGVHTTALVGLGLTRSGALDVPEDAGTAGWFTLSPVPGEVGPAVLAAHVDYDRVPGLFARLHEVEPGDEAVVTRSDGAPVRFTAYRVERFGKSAFPTADVYGNTAGPELRLITCGGDFDRAAGHYRDNVVVFARLA